MRNPTFRGNGEERYIMRVRRGVPPPPVDTNDGRNWEAVTKRALSDRVKRYGSVRIEPELNYPFTHVTPYGDDGEAWGFRP